LHVRVVGLDASRVEILLSDWDWGEVVVKWKKGTARGKAFEMRASENGKAKEGSSRLVKVGGNHCVVTKTFFSLLG
jgi:hypothetical protein